MNFHSLGTGKDCGCVIFLALLPHGANTVFFASPVVVKLQRGNLQWLVQGHGGLPKVSINSKTTPTPTPPKTSNVRCPAWLRITWQACLQGQCPLPQPAGSEVRKLSWNSGGLKSRIMNSALSAPPSALDLKWAAVSLPLTGTALTVAPCTKRFLP